MTEKLTFKEAFIEGGAVDFDERFFIAGTDLVNGACHQFFPRAALTQDHHRGRGGGDAFHQVKNTLDGIGPADHAVKAFFQVIGLSKGVHLHLFMHQFRLVGKHFNSADDFVVIIFQYGGILHHMHGPLCLVGNQALFFPNCTGGKETAERLSFFLTENLASRTV